MSQPTQPDDAHVTVNDHVVVSSASGQKFICKHCGATYRPALPCSVGMLVAMMEQFGYEHEKCPPPAAAEPPALGMPPE